MRLNIEKLMIGFVMILAVCLYAPTLLEDYKANSTTNEKVTEVLAEAPAPAMTTESMVLAAVTTQERIGEAVQAAKVTESIGNDMTKAVTTDVAKLTPKFQTNMNVTNMIEETSVADRSMLQTMVEARTNPVYSEFIAHVKSLPVEIKPSLMASDERDKVLAVRDNYDEFLKTVETYYAEKAVLKTAQNAQTYVTTYTNQTGRKADCIQGCKLRTKRKRNVLQLEYEWCRSNDAGNGNSRAVLGSRGWRKNVR